MRNGLFSPRTANVISFSCTFSLPSVVVGGFVSVGSDGTPHDASTKSIRAHIAHSLYFFIIKHILLYGQKYAKIY